MNLLTLLIKHSIYVHIPKHLAPKVLHWSNKDHHSKNHLLYSSKIHILKCIGYNKSKLLEFIPNTDSILISPQLQQSKANKDCRYHRNAGKFSSRRPQRTHLFCLCRQIDGRGSRQMVRVIIIWDYVYKSIRRPNNWKGNKKNSVTF